LGEVSGLPGLRRTSDALDACYVASWQLPRPDFPPMVTPPAAPGFLRHIRKSADSDERYVDERYVFGY